MHYPLTDFPSGGEPYHPKEMGAGTKTLIQKKTGLLGVLFMVAAVFAAVGVALVTSLFVLLGLAEFVTTTPTSWRVRWIRRDP